MQKDLQRGEERIDAEIEARQQEPYSQEDVDGLERAQRKLAAAAARIRSLTIERDGWRQKHDVAIRERDRDRSALTALKQSKSYRLGRAMVLLVKDPLRTIPKIVRAVVRLVVQRWAASTDATALTPATRSNPVRATAAAAHANSRMPVLSDNFSVCAYVAFGFDLDTLRALARVVGQSALVCGNHVPLVVTDFAGFSMLRDTGLAIEYIPDRATWEQHRGDVEWDRFRADRLGQLLRVHQPTKIFFVSSAEPLDLAWLLGSHMEPRV